MARDVRRRQRRRPVVAGCLVLAAAIAVGSSAWAADEGSAPEVEPGDVLRGEEAVRELVATGELADVAADVGVAPAELVEELRNDGSLFLTEGGILGYADVAEPLVDFGPPSALAPPPGVNVSALNSRPGSSKVLFIDFDGHSVVNDPAWAQYTPHGGTQLSAPYDTDGSPAFSAAEQAVMFEVWQRVSEDYLPFDVNVTTIAPNPGDLEQSSPSDQRFGQRVVVTPSNFVAPFSSGVLGVALLGTFGAGRDIPAYVFTDTPSARLVKTMAEAVSHEAGHTFGLFHDADTATTVDYYDGHGSWAPIMGLPIAASRTVTQWSRGEYNRANNQEDDLAEIAAFLGYRPDDHGDSAPSATPIPSVSTTNGFIGRTGERDVFRVDAGAGTLSASLSPPPGATAWSNLLARLTVRNAFGAVVTTASPTVPSGWSVSVNVAVPAGRYTLEVEPIGWLNASTGFTPYASLGAYQLTVNAPAGLAPPPGPNGAAFTPITPDRVLDTRNGIGAGGPLRAGNQVVVQVTGASVPPGATAAVVNVTADRTTAGGYLTVHPCEPSVPNTSTLNFFAGQVVANTTIAALSPAGQLCVWASAGTDVLVDVTGWLGPSGSSLFSPIGPTRVVDTRNNVGGTRLGPGGVLQVDLNGRVPAGTTAVALNITSDRSAAPGYLTAYPCGALPSTSTVNHAAGIPRPNNTIVGLTGGRLCIFSFASTDVLVDLTGAFGPFGLRYLPTAPVRVLDTRQTQPPIPAGGAVGYSVAAPALGGRQPAAAFVNVTATEHSRPGYVTTYDCGPLPDTSTLNQQVGEDVANGANVPLSGLQSCGWLFGGGHLIVDVNGWWVP